MNGITCSQAERHAWPITGSCLPHFSSNASSAWSATSGVARGVDRLQIFDHGVVLTARHVLQAVADQMHDARLDRGLGEHGLDRFGEPFEAVDAADEDVLGSRVA